jgi:excisionase family DNA binding protein
VTTEPSAPVSRFLTLDDVAAELNISKSQVYALVRGQHLPSLKIGGRGQYRVERPDLEAYIKRTKIDTAAWIADHPWTGGEPDDQD